MLSRHLILTKSDVHNASGEYLQVLSVSSCTKLPDINGLARLDVICQEIDCDPDADCILLYAIANEDQLAMYALYKDENYSVDQHVYNRATLTLLDALKNCDGNKLKELASQLADCYWHEYDIDGPGGICLNCESLRRHKQVPIGLSSCVYNSTIVNDTTNMPKVTQPCPHEK